MTRGKGSPSQLRQLHSQSHYGFPSPSGYPRQSQAISAHYHFCKQRHTETQPPSGPMMHLCFESGAALVNHLALSGKFVSLWFQTPQGTLEAQSVLGVRRVKFNYSRVYNKSLADLSTSLNVLTILNSTCVRPGIRKLCPLPGVGVG